MGEEGREEGGGREEEGDEIEATKNLRRTCYVPAAMLLCTPKQLAW